jgi:hypothetical protein
MWQGIHPCLRPDFPAILVDLFPHQTFKRSFRSQAETLNTRLSNYVNLGAGANIYAEVRRVPCPQMRDQHDVQKVQQRPLGVQQHADALHIAQQLAVGLDRTLTSKETMLFVRYHFLVCARTPVL